MAMKGVIKALELLFIIIIIFVILNEVFVYKTPVEGEYLHSDMKPNADVSKHFKVTKIIDSRHYIVENVNGKSYYVTLTRYGDYIIGGEY